MTKMIRITAKKDGFRRAGIAHPAAPTEYSADAFSEAQLATLRAEKMLVVEDVAAEVAEAETAPKKKGGAA